MSNVIKLIGSSKILKELLEEKRESITEVLPSHLSSNPRYTQRMIKAILMSVTRQPKLLQCTKLSMMQAVLTAAELGLDPCGTLGSGYLIPFKGQVVFMAGYRGLIELALRSKDILDIEAQVVYEKDIYEVTKGLHPNLVHIPHEGADRGKVRAAYMVTTLANGIKKFENMWVDEIEKVRNCSKAPNSPAWIEFYGQMCRKSVIRRGMKYLPLSIESERALVIATRAEDQFLGLPDIEEVGTAIPKEGRTSFGGKAKKEILDVPQIADDQEKALIKDMDTEELNIEIESEDLTHGESTEQAGKEQEETNFDESLGF